MPLGKVRVFRSGMAIPIRLRDFHFFHLWLSIAGEPWWLPRAAIRQVQSVTSMRYAPAPPSVLLTLR